MICSGSGGWLYRPQTELLYESHDFGGRRRAFISRASTLTLISPSAVRTLLLRATDSASSAAAAHWW